MSSSNFEFMQIPGRPPLGLRLGLCKQIMNNTANAKKYFFRLYVPLLEARTHPTPDRTRAGLKNDLLMPVADKKRRRRNHFNIFMHNLS
jgi:hypothetical protein